MINIFVVSKKLALAEFTSTLNRRGAIYMNIIVRQINPHHVIIQVVKHLVLTLRTRRFLFCSLISLGFLVDLPVPEDADTGVVKSVEEFG